MLDWASTAWQKTTGWFRTAQSDRDSIGRDPGREKVKAGPGPHFPNFLPFYDDQQNLGETQAIRLAYRKMLSDPYIKAALFGKLMGVMALDLQAHPARSRRGSSRPMKRDEEIAEFVKWNLTYRLEEGIPGMVWDITSGACLDGHSVNEKVWLIEDKGEWKGKQVLRRLKAKDTGHDVVLETDQYKNVTGVRALRFNSGEVYHPKDFLIYTHLGLFENPTGMSDFRAAYRAYWMIDTVTKLRAIGAEKRALPVIAGEWPHEKYQASLEAALAKIKSQNWLAVPKDVKLQALDIAGRSEEFFKSFRDDCVEEIFLAIEGAFLHAMAGGEGKHRGSAKSAQTRSDLFKWHLSAAVAHLINDRDRGLIPDMVDFNFAGVEDYPRITLSGIDDQELKTSLDIDKGLQEMGWHHNIEELEERYGRKWAGPTQESLVPPKELQQQMQQQQQLLGGMDDLFADDFPEKPGGAPGTGPGDATMAA